jgi:hypothetical protein
MSIRLGLNISVSPRSLFAAFTAPAIAKLLFSNDEPGVFYDFDDWSTLFQDTAGTQPVTAANQGVALALDKRLGLKLGPELVDTLPVGALSLAAFGSASQTNTTVVGRTYEFDIVVSDYVSGALDVGTGGLGTASNRAVQNINANGTHKVLFVATDTSIQYRARGDGFVGTILISVRELKGNHATQATTAARPLTVIHPDGGVRNLANGSAAPANDTFWVSSTAQNGITATRISTGATAEGKPWARYQVTGTATANSFPAFYIRDRSRALAAPAQTWISSAFLQIESGNSGADASTGVRVAVREETAPTTTIGESNSDSFKGTELTLISVARTFSTGNQAAGNIFFRVQSGDTVNCVVYVEA